MSQAGGGGILLIALRVLGIYRGYPDEVEWECFWFLPLLPHQPVLMSELRVYSRGYQVLPLELGTRRRKKKWPSIWT